jgi:uncharacterized OB-fold protein
MTALEIQRCQTCADSWFPDRLRCPRCGGRDFSRIPAGRGTVEETTAKLGSIRLDAGPVVIASVRDGTKRGARVSLDHKPDGEIRA